MLDNLILKRSRVLGGFFVVVFFNDGDYSIVSIQGLSNRLPPPFFKFHIHVNRSGPLGENAKTPMPRISRVAP